MKLELLLPSLFREPSSLMLSLMLAILVSYIQQIFKERLSYVFYYLPPEKSIGL